MKLRISPAALDDLQEIKRYISQDLDNATSACNLMKKIMDRMRIVCDFPEAGALLSSRINVPTSYRFIPIGHYLAFYRIKEDTVFMDRVLFAQRDYMKILFKNEPPH